MRLFPISAATCLSILLQPGPLHSDTYQASDRPPQRWALAGPGIAVGGDGEEGPTDFNDIVAAFLVAGDRLLVADGKTSQLRQFSFPDMRHLRTIGGAGRGPGEISDLWTVWRSPTGFVVEDAAGTASLFNARGDFVRVLPREVPVAGRRVERVGPINDTLFVAKLQDTIPAMNAGDSRMLRMQLLVVTARSSRVIARSDEREVIRGATGRPRTPVFGATSVAAVVGNRVCVGYPARYRIDCYAPDGRHISRTERRGLRAAPVRPAHKEDFFASEAAANPGPNGAAYIARLRRTVPFAEVMSHFGEFIAASNGDLWVGPYIPVGPIPMKRPFPRDESTWSVYAPDGRWKADVVFPARFHLLSVDGMRAVGVRRDQDDVESIVVYTLRVQQ